MKKILSVVFAGLVSTSAFAIENTFTFTVESSGPDMYACNAGLKHKNPAGQVGYTVGDGTTLTNDGGDYLVDVMQYSFGEYDEWTDTYSPIHTNKRVSANGSNSWVAVAYDGQQRTNYGFYRVGNDPQGNTLVLENLKFELSSERYGAEYFVDICYYGPRFHNGAVGTYYGASAQVTMTNTFSKDYLLQANLLVKGRLKCDGALVAETAYAPATSGNLSVLWNDLNIGSVAKKVCVTRFFFKEHSTGKRMNIEHGSNVVVRAEITDPAGE